MERSFGLPASSKWAMGRAHHDASCSSGTHWLDRSMGVPCACRQDLFLVLLSVSGWSVHSPIASGAFSVFPLDERASFGRHVEARDGRWRLAAVESCSRAHNACWTACISLWIAAGVIDRSSAPTTPPFAFSNAAGLKTLRTYTQKQTEKMRFFAAFALVASAQGKLAPSCVLGGWLLSRVVQTRCVFGSPGRIC